MYDINTHFIWLVLIFLLSLWLLAIYLPATKHAGQPVHISGLCPLNATHLGRSCGLRDFPGSCDALKRPSRPSLSCIWSRASEPYMFDASSQCVIWFIYNNGDKLECVPCKLNTLNWFYFLRVHSHLLLITCSLNPKLQSRFGALNDLVNSMHVIEPFQNGSSVGTRIGKQFFGSYDSTDNTLSKFNHCMLI